MRKRKSTLRKFGALTRELLKCANELHSINRRIINLSYKFDSMEAEYEARRLSEKKPYTDIGQVESEERMRKEIGI